MDPTKRKTIGDMKAGLTQGARPKFTILPRTAQVYQCRALEYGADKYARGNYHGPSPEELVKKFGPEAAPVMRVMGYLDALGRHSSRISDAVNKALGTGGDVRAAFAGAIDTEASGSFPASMLHDLAHAMACVGLAISCAVDDGLLPADLGQPWAAALAEAELPQKDDPASERRRIEAAAEARVAAAARAQIEDDAMYDAFADREGCEPSGGGAGGVRW
jgi:hypothetical protein